MLVEQGLLKRWSSLHPELLVQQQPTELNISRSYLFPLKEDLYSSALILYCSPSNTVTLTAGVRNLIC